MQPAQPANFNMQFVFRPGVVIQNPGLPADFLTAVDVFGFHSESQMRYLRYGRMPGANLNISRGQIMLLNIYKMIHWLPIVGTIMGLWSIHAFKEVGVTSLGDNGYKTAFKARFIVETLSLGFLLIIPDLIISAGRALKCW